MRKTVESPFDPAPFNSNSAKLFRPRAVHDDSYGPRNPYLPFVGCCPALSTGSCQYPYARESHPEVSGLENWHRGKDTAWERNAQVARQRGTQHLRI